MEVILIKSENLLTGGKKYFINCSEAVEEAKEYLFSLTLLKDYLKGDIVDRAFKEYGDFVLLHCYASEYHLRDALEKWGGLGGDIIKITKMPVTGNVAKVYKALRDCPNGASIIAIKAMAGIDSSSSVLGSLVGLERYGLVERIETHCEEKCRRFWKLKED